MNVKSRGVTNFNQNYTDGLLSKRTPNYEFI